jgi:DNA-directed RNA polymerase
MVEKGMQEELERDPNNKRARLLIGKVSRKVVKQTVMTTVYGVTFVGAREQIDRQLRDRGDIPAEECYMAAAYLAKQVRGCRSLPTGWMSFDMLAPSLGIAMHR